MIPPTAVPILDTSLLAPLIATPIIPADLNLSKLTETELRYLLKTFNPSVLSPDQDPDLYSDPYSIPLNSPLIVNLKDTLYTHIKDTESFYIDDDPSNIITFNKLIKTTFSAAKSYYSSIRPPQEFYHLGQSTRVKIMSCLFLHLSPPPISEETNTFVTLFKYLAYSPNAQKISLVSRSWSAACFAADYNEELASSLLLHYGMPSAFREINVKGSSIHTITKTEDGVVVDIINPHTVQERLDAACSAMILGKNLSQLNITLFDLIAIGLKEFYSYNKTLISLSRETTNSIQSEIRRFAAQLLTAFDEIDTPEFPIVEEPQNFLPKQVLNFSFSSFEVLTGITDEKQDQINDLAAAKTSKTILQQLSTLQADVVYSRQDLLMHINKNRLTAFLKKGYLIRIKSAKYIVTPLYIKLIAENQPLNL